MSNKSPGVYITENDISTFTVADGSTVVAIIGYATKGPIGVPTVVNSYQKFVETFGSPTIIGYSGLAVKNVFSVGNTVVFYRVADSTATSSRKIIKNAIAAVFGYQTFEKNTDVLVGTDNYVNGKIYAINVAESNDAEALTKTVYVRTPISGKLAISDILGQISSQIGRTAGYQEIKLSNSYANAGWYSFNFKVDDDVGAAPVGGVSPAEIGSGDDVCSFIELTTADKYDTIKTKVEAASKAGSNPIAVLSLDKIGAAVVFPVVSDVVGVATTTSLNCQFNLIVNGATYTIDILVTPLTKFSDLVESINKIVKAYGVFCLFQAGNNTSGIPAKLVFVSKSRGVGNTISVQPLTTLAAGKQNLFVLDAAATPDQPFTYTAVGGLSYIELVNFETFEGRATKKNETTSSLYRFSVELDEYTKGLKIVSATVGEDSKISLIDGAYGVSLLNQTLVVGPEIGPVLTAVDGTESINVSVVRDSVSRKIKFVSTTITPPLVSALDVLPSNVGDLEDIILKVEEAVTGSIAIDASEKDMIIMNSIEKGTETALIAIEKTTVSNPLDTGTDYVNINVYYNGALKETFSNVSLNKNDTENRFDVVINNTIENGGSAYANLDFIKNEDGDIINFPNGIYYLGKGTSTEVAATEETNLEDYNTYDYALGTNGIPSTGGAELFSEALSTTGELANTDLYNYHILVTPDNIEQEVQEAAIELAEFRKDFIYFCDPPFGITSEAVKRWHNGQGYGREVAINSSYATVYWPWFKLYDTTNKKYIWAPPSTIIAAKYVSVDKTYGSWFAPAGELRGKITVGDIEYSPKLSERDDIYTGMNRINPIIKFNDGRTIIFGEKTCLRENSALSKVHTRRMLIDIKKQVRAALQSFLFLPNVSDVWNKAAGAINAILEPYKRGGGISYYNTVIDSSTVTAEMQQQDIMAGTIHIVPTGVIEDIEISLNVDKVGETVTVE